MSEENAFEFSNAVTAIERRDCFQLKKLFSNIVVLSKSSSSESVLFSAVIQDKPVIVKCTFPDLEDFMKNNDREGEYAPLVAEEIVYEYTTRLVKERVSPHFVVSLGTIRCHLQNLHDAMSEIEYRKFATQMTTVYERYGRTRTLERIEPVRMLIMEKANGLSLEKWIQTPNVTDDEVLYVLFQIIYSLHILQKRGVRHGDLHCGNVLVEPLPLLSQKKMVAYFPDSGVGVDENSKRSSLRNPPIRFFEIPWKPWMARIYDYDWGGIYERDVRSLFKDEKPGNVVPFHPLKNVKNISAQKECHKYSSCGHNQRADLYTLLASMYGILQNFPNTHLVKVRKFLTASVDERLLTFGQTNSAEGFAKSDGFAYRLCGGPIEKEKCPLTKTEINWDKTKMCSNSWDPPSCWMMSPLEILNTAPEFLQYQHWYPQEQVTTSNVYGDWNNEHSRRMQSLVLPKKEHVQKIKRFGLW